MINAVLAAISDVEKPPLSLQLAENPTLYICDDRCSQLTDSMNPHDDIYHTIQTDQCIKLVFAIWRLTKAEEDLRPYCYRQSQEMSFCPGDMVMLEGESIRLAAYPTCSSMIQKSVQAAQRDL